MSVLTDIADDIVTAIDAGTYAIVEIEPFNAARKQVIDPELIETDKLVVLVAPRTIDISLLNRNALLNIYTFQIAVIKKITTEDDTDFDNYMTFIEELGDELTRLASTSQTSASWTGLTLPVSYSPKALRENSLFFAIIETRYRMGR